jgi:hypothetical protein
LSDRILIAENGCAALFVSTVVSPARSLCADVDRPPYMAKAPVSRVEREDPLFHTLTECPVIALPVGPSVQLTIKAMNARCSWASLAGGLAQWRARGPRVDSGKPTREDGRAVSGVCPMPLDADVHLVLCSFGRTGLAYAEAEPAESDASTIVRNLLYGQYGHPLRVVAMNVEEGWCRDVSDAMADKVREVAQRENMELTDGTLAFLEAHEPQVKQAMLPLW